MLGLALVGAVAIATTSLIFSAAEQQVPTALRGGLLAKQRAVAHALTAHGFALAAHRTAADTVSAGADHRAVLAATHGTLQAVHQILRHGADSLDLPPADAALSERLAALEPSLRDMDVRVRALLQESKTGSPRAIEMGAEALAAQTARFSDAIDALDAGTVAAQAADVRRLQRLALGFLVTLVAVLVFEWLMVFRPSARTIGRLLRAQADAARELRLKTVAMERINAKQEDQNSTLQTQRETLLEQQDELVAQQRALIEQRDHLEERAAELSRLTAILDATPDAVAVFSLTGGLLYSNSAADDLLTHARERNWTHAAHLLMPSSLRRLRDVGFPRAIRRGLWQSEVQLRARVGPERSAILTLLAHRDVDGRVTTVSVMLQDISEQMRMQGLLSEGERRNRAVIDALAEGVLVQDASGRSITWNAGAERILGVTGDQLASRTAFDAAWQLVDERGAPYDMTRHPIARATREGALVDGEVLGVSRGDGTTVWVSMNARPMTAADSESGATAVATFTDITRARAVARELETLSLVARQSDHSILTTDAGGVITWVNHSFERLTGFTLADAVGRKPGELLQGPKTNPDVVAQIRTAVRTGSSFAGELLNYRREGSPYWVELNITPTFDDTGALAGFVGLSRDITARRDADREREQLAAAVSVTADGIAITGVSGSLDFVNHAFARMHGATPDDLIDTPWAALYDPEESRRLVRDAIGVVTQVGFWQGEATGRKADGTAYPQELSLTLLPHGGLVAVARDISDRKAVEARLLHLSVRDELTSLYNRRGFLEQADLMLSLAQRQGLRCALLYGDLDAFKTVNDGFGHNAGDAALVEIAGILSGTFRKTDLIARLGGDEFTILAIDLDPADVTRLIDRVNEAVATSNTMRAGDPMHGWRLGISLGVAYFDPATPENVETLLRSADAAQYEQKRRKKSQAA